MLSKTASFENHAPARLPLGFGIWSLGFTPNHPTMNALPMRRQVRQLLLILMFSAAGCAGRNTSAPIVKAPSSTTQPTDRKANLTLDQITPAPQFSMPTTQPTTRPSLDALVFYARAHDAMAEGHRF